MVDTAFPNSLYGDLNNEMQNQLALEVQHNRFAQDKRSCLSNSSKHGQASCQRRFLWKPTRSERSPPPTRLVLGGAFTLWAALFPLASLRRTQKSLCMCCKYVRKRFGQTEISFWINCLLQLSIYENSCTQLEKCGKIPPQINLLFAFC